MINLLKTTEIGRNFFGALTFQVRTVTALMQLAKRE
jgi:hypothetical protein